VGGDPEQENIETEGSAESITVTLPGIAGVRKLTLNTAQVQEKTQAARSVYEIATAMGSSFGPYAEVS